MREAIKFILVHIIASTLLAANCFTSYAISANITPDGGSVSVDRAGNNVPIVNINNPNGTGISHNQYINYNVGEKGLILNNSCQMGVSVLGGIVSANPNLSQSAHTIINEVTGPSRSNILGPQEIFGNKANYILANPNGITVNGGQFINAHSAMLTTGKIGLDAIGNLEKLLIDQGDVNIHGKGLNVHNLDYFTIIARTTQLNAAIHASKQGKAALNPANSTADVEVITGQGEYKVATKKFKPTNKGNAVKPAISIDSSSLGGLYAGKITIESNEAGVGVNLPQLASVSGDISISSDGKIVHKGINSAKNIKIESKNNKIVSVGKQGTFAKGEVHYKAKDAIKRQNSNAVLRAGGKITLESEGKVTNSAVIASDSTKGIEIKAGLVQNQGTIYVVKWDRVNTLAFRRTL